MKNRIVVVLICFVLMFSVVSCDDQEKNIGYGSMSVEVSNVDNSKTIQPTDESLGFTSYVIKGRYGTNEDWIVNESFSSKSIEIDHLEVGNWEFVVEGFNKDNVLLAKSEPHIVVIETNGLAKETYTLDWIDGFGSLKLSVKVQSSRVVSIECQLYDENGNVVGSPYTMEKEDFVLQGDGLYLFEKVFGEVPAGFYNAKIVMKDKDGEPIGKTLNQSVHIHDGLESSFDFSWKGFSNLMPQVDVPKPSFDDGTSIPCDSKILLNTEEENASIFYSFDGKSYSSYTEDGIDLSQMQDLSNSIKIWVYAEKANLNKSDVGTYTFNIEHQVNAVYTWNSIEDGYECVATYRCPYHKSSERETERATVSCEILVDSSEHEEGKCQYIAVFENERYSTQSKEGSVPTKHSMILQVAESPTCTETGWNEYVCSDCDYTIRYREIPALGHDFSSFKRLDDEWHEAVCSRCSETMNNKSVHSFKNYRCTECGTWNRGPAGGYVFYDKGEYSGSPSWRYLEAAPDDLCLVNGAPSIYMDLDGVSRLSFIFGYYKESYDGDLKYCGTKAEIGEGFNNTNLLIAKMKEAAYTTSYRNGSVTTSDYAALLCKSLIYEGKDGKVFSDWFLPSRYELNLMYENLYKNGLSFSPIWSGAVLYWSSTEANSVYAWWQDFQYGGQGNHDRGYDGHVRPVRAF